MADEHHFPTAIVPAQPGSVAQRFDRLARAFGDPMAKLFLLQSAKARHPLTGEATDNPDLDMQFKAAAELMPYRYPKLKIQENRGDAGGGGGGVVIQINLGGEAPPTIDVTPQPEVDPLS